MVNKLLYLLLTFTCILPVSSTYSKLLNISDYTRPGCHVASEDGLTLLCVTYDEGHHSGKIFQVVLYFLKINGSELEVTSKKVLDISEVDNPKELIEKMLFPPGIFLDKRHVVFLGDTLKGRVYNPDRTLTLKESTDVDIDEQLLRVTLSVFKTDDSNQRSDLLWEHPYYEETRVFWIEASRVFVIEMNYEYTDDEGLSDGGTELLFIGENELAVPTSDPPK